MYPDNLKRIAGEHPVFPRARLIIKGTEDDALIALNAHGFVNYTIVGPTRALDSMAVDVSAETAPICEWYGEVPHAAPYPVGALLFFSLTVGL